MTRQSIIERAARLEKPGPALIARFHPHGEPVDYPVSEDDLERDVDFWRGVLAGYGVGRGSRVVVTALAWELPWFQPARVAVARLGGSYSNAEFWGWDARRLEMFCRRLEPQVVIGPGRELVEGLGNIVDPAERLGGVRGLLVRPDALETLRDAGVTPAGIVTPIGPTVAVSLADGSGVAIDDTQWRIDEQDGELLATSVAPRAAAFERQRTGVRGRVERTPTGPRLVLEPEP